MSLKDTDRALDGIRRTAAAIAERHGATITGLGVDLLVGDTLVQLRDGTVQTAQAGLQALAEPVLDHFEAMTAGGDL